MPTSPEAAVVDAITQPDPHPTAGATTAPTPWPTRITIAATLVALALGLFRLGELSFWYDEAFTIGTVDRPVGDALWRIAHWEVNQSPYYLLMTGWVRLGDSEAFLRLLSVAFWVGTVPLLYVLGRRLFDARVGAFAAVLYALHGFALEWGQQVRGYTMVAFAATLATYLFVRLVEEPGSGRAVAYAAVAAVAAYTQFFALLVIAAHAVSLFAVHLTGARRRAVVLAGITLAVLLVPLGLFLLTADGDPVAWVSAPSRGQAFEVLRDLSGGGWIQVMAYVAAVAAAVVTLVGVVRRDGRGPSTWRHVLPVLWLGVPVVVTAVASATVKPMLVPRYLLLVVPALALVAALGVCRLGGRRLAAVGMAALIAVSVVGVVDTNRRDAYEDWRRAVATLVEQAEPGDEVVVLPGRAVHSARFYLEQHEDADLSLMGPDDLGALEGDQVWVLDRRSQGPSDAGRDLLGAGLARNYELVGDLHFRNVDVRRYQRR